MIVAKCLKDLEDYRISFHHINRIKKKDARLMEVHTTSDLSSNRGLLDRDYTIILTFQMEQLRCQSFNGRFGKYCEMKFSLGGKITSFSHECARSTSGGVSWLLLLKGVFS